MQVRYTRAPEVRVARAEPLARDNAWTFLATLRGLSATRHPLLAA